MLDTVDIAATTDGSAVAPDTLKRRQILDGARRVFLAKGFDGASMGEIARAAAVSKGTLYVYFDSKEALFTALTHSERSSLAEVLFSLDETGDDIRAVLTDLGNSLLAHMIAPDHISAVRMVIGAADRFPQFGQMFYEAGPASGAARLAAYLDRQVAAGRLAIADTPVAAEQFLNLCSSGILKRALFAVKEHFAAEDLRRNVDRAVDVFFAAYAPRP